MHFFAGNTMSRWWFRRCLILHKPTLSHSMTRWLS